VISHFGGSLPFQNQAEHMSLIQQLPKVGMAMCEILTHLLPTAGEAEADQRNKSEGPGSEGTKMCKTGFSGDAIATFRSGWHQRLLRSNHLRVVVEGLCKNYGRTVSVECAFVTETGSY
jgi:hypothetical protein